VQVNGRYANLDDSGADLDTIGVDGFLFNRRSSGAYGAFLGFDNFDTPGGDVDEVSIGGFLQLYSGDANWTAQLGFSDTEDDFEVLHLDGEGRFFLSPDFSAQVHFGVGDIDAPGGGDDDFWTGGVGGEWRFAGSPFSLYGGWNHVDFDGGDSDQLGIGLRWNFGGGTLLDRSRSGASYQRVSPTLSELLVGGSVAPR
jgi:hypothetical protein